VGIGRLCSRNCGKVIPDRQKYREDCNECSRVQFERAKHKSKRMESADKPKDFYNSSAWKNLSKFIRSRAGGICEMCGGKWATVTHHILPAKLFPNLRLSIENLEAACDSCHATERARESHLYVKHDYNSETLRRVFLDATRYKHPKLFELVRLP